MSVYSVKGKGWRYDFTLKGTRHTRGWFKRKRDAVKAETERREELLNPPAPTPTEQTPTDMGFLELVNRRLDHVKAYNSDEHYRSYLYMARRWSKIWGHKFCGEITQQMVQRYLTQRRRISAFTANKDLRYLRAAFNFGKRKKLILSNPTNGIDFFPVEKKVKYVPSNEDIDKVIAAADPENQDYLWTIRETLARVGEINRLKWEDVNLELRFVILYTRKKHGAEGQNRTADTGIFSPLLYRLSYLGAAAALFHGSTGNFHPPSVSGFEPFGGGQGHGSLGQKRSPAGDTQFGQLAH
jgi:hypothetical protein